MRGRGSSPAAAALDPLSWRYAGVLTHAGEPTGGRLDIEA